jgi:hypothetical protein
MALFVTMGALKPSVKMPPKGFQGPFDTAILLFEITMFRFAS